MFAVFLIERAVAVRLWVESEGSLPRLSGLLDVLRLTLASFIAGDGVDPSRTGSDSTEQEGRCHRQQVRVSQVGLSHLSRSRTLDERVESDSGTGSDSSEERKVVLGLAQDWIEFELGSLVFRFLREQGQIVRVRVQVRLDQETFERSGRQHSRDGTDGDRHETGNQGDSPVSATQSNDLEGGTTEFDNEDLTADHDGEDKHEPVVLEEAFKDVELSVQSSVVDHIENLGKHKDVKDQCLEFGSSFVIVVEAEDAQTSIVQDETDDDLVKGLHEDHLDHFGGQQRSVFAFGFSVER